MFFNFNIISQFDNVFQLHLGFMSFLGYFSDPCGYGIKALAAYIFIGDVLLQA